MCFAGRERGGGGGVGGGGTYVIEFELIGRIAILLLISAEVAADGLRDVCSGGLLRSHDRMSGPMPAPTAPYGADGTQRSSSRRSDCRRRNRAALLWQVEHSRKWLR